MHVARKGIQHRGHQVIDIEQLELDRRVVNLKFAAVGDGVAERRHGRVVPRAAPLPVEVRETIDQRLRPSALLVTGRAAPRQPACSRRRGSRHSGPRAKLERWLDEHHWALVAVVLEQGKQRLAEAPVALHELGGVLRSVDARQVEHEVSTRAIGTKLFLRAIAIVLVDRQRQELRILPSPVLAIADILEGLAEVAAQQTPWRR